VPLAARDPSAICEHNSPRQGENVMSRPVRLLGVLLVATSISGCLAEKDEHPPVCTDVNCIPTGSTRFTPSGSGGTGNTSTDVAGSGGVVTLTGQIIELNEPTFSVTSMLAPVSSSTFTVRAPGPAGTELNVANMGSLFTLNGVRATRTAWLVAAPTGASDLLPGLYAFDATTASNVTIPLVRRSSLEMVSGTLTTYTTLDSGKAQVVLRFVDPNGLAVSGVNVSLDGAERVAYDVGVGYSDDATATGTRGLAFLFNVDSAKTPAVRALQLRGTVTGEIGIWVSTGVTTAQNLLVSKR
jgi:hypothetical protein